MRRSHSLTFTGPDTSDYIRKGTLKIAKGKAMAGIRCKIVFPIRNASGGALTLSAADKTALLDALRFNFAYGAEGSEREFLKNAKGSIVRLLQRFAIGSDVEGLTDATTGMSRSLPGSNAITNCTIYLVVPTGRLWFLGVMRNLFCMGRSQAQSLKAEIARQAAPTLSANLSLPDTSAVTCEIQPWLVSVKGDRESVMPEYREFTIRDFRAELPDGVPLFISERTAAHASTGLTRVNVNFDAEEIHRDAPPADILSEYNDVPNYPSDAAIFDTHTILYQATPDRSLAELPTGKPFVEQPNKDLSDFNLGYYWLPIVKEEERKTNLAYYANSTREKTIKAVSLDVIESINAPSRLSAVIPAMLTDEDDAEHHRYAGLGVPHRGKADDARVFVPDVVLERAKAFSAAFNAAGSPKAAQAVAKDLARSVPGLANSGRGFGGSMFNQLRQVIGG